MTLEATRNRRALTVRVREPRLDASKALDFKEKMRELIQQGHRTILLNLGEVEFMDSSGLGALVSSLKMLGRGGKLALCEIQEPVRALLRTTRLDRVFPIFASQEQGLKKL